MVPESVPVLGRAGVRVLAEHGAGAAACFPDGAGADRPAAGRPGGHRHAAPLVQPELARQLARGRPGTVLALVVPTDEELLIARDTARLIPAVVASGCDR